MKLSVIIKRFFKSRDFCYPKDFYWADMNKAKSMLPKFPDRIIPSTLYYLAATLSCFGYYITIPFRIINEWCESWCNY